MNGKRAKEIRRTVKYLAPSLPYVNYANEKNSRTRVLHQCQKALEKELKQRYMDAKRKPINE